MFPNPEKKKKLRNYAMTKPLSGPRAESSTGCWGPYFPAQLPAPLHFRCVWKGGRRGGRGGKGRVCREQWVNLAAFICFYVARFLTRE